MMIRPKRIFLGLAALALLIQFVPYGREHTIPAATGEPAWASPRVRELAKRACFDCHSNETVWPWYASVATFRLVALPLLGPGLASVAIFNLAAYWSEFCLALVLLDSQARFTIPVGLFSFQSGYETEWHLVAAASFIGLLPVLAAFILLQRFFVAGLTAGATKG